MNTPIFIACIIAAAVGILLCAMFFRPIKALLALLLHTVLGWVGLSFLNTLCAPIAFSMGINIASSTVAGILGLPGVCLIAALKWIYHI